MARDCPALTAALAIALAVTGLAASPTRAQAPLGVELASDCPAAIPSSDLSRALSLELDPTEMALVSSGAELRILVSAAPCGRDPDALTLVLARGSDVVLGPEALDVRELRARHRGRVVALWIAEHVRAALDVPAPDVPPPPRTPSSEPLPPMHVEPLVPPAPLATTLDARPAPRARDGFFARGSLAFAFAHDFPTAGFGPGVELHAALGMRGRPGVAGEVGVGAGGLSMSGNYGWTELHASLGALMDVVWDETWSTAFGMRVLFVHEVLIRVPAATRPNPPLRIDDGLELRASAFARTHVAISSSLSAFLELELTTHLFALLGSPYRTELAPNGFQGTARIGLAIE